MNAFQERVIEEKEQLDDKIAKLTKFIGGKVWAGLTDYEQNLLQVQLNHMRDYSATLAKRIEVFNG